MVFSFLFSKGVDKNMQPDFAPVPHNSTKNKPEDKKIEKVVTGKVQVKKKTGVSKLASNFISEDAANIKSYVVLDVLIPAVKKAISDIVTNGIDMILYGGSGKKNTDRFGNRRVISYDRCFDSRDSRRDTSKTRARFDYDNLIFPTRGEAEAVRDQMEDVIKRYGYVTVADMYDMADLTAPYTSNKYGWTSIRNAEPVRVRDGGYILTLPNAMPID